MKTDQDENNNNNFKMKEINFNYQIVYIVAIERNATTYFLTLKAYNSLTTYVKTIILYLF